MGGDLHWFYFRRTSLRLLTRTPIQLLSGWSGMLTAPASFDC